MKKYVKPQMIIEEFRADESICTCTDRDSIYSFYPLSFGSWHRWTDKNSDRQVQNSADPNINEVGDSFDPRRAAPETSFVIYGPLYSGRHGTIEYVENGLVGITVYYRNAS